MQHSIFYCGEFGKVIGCSSVGENQVVVNLVDSKNNKTYLFRIDGIGYWNQLDNSIKVNQLRQVLISNGVRLVSEQVSLQ